MLHYYKTSQGEAALKNRQVNLNVRQRRLLLLIGTDDFKHLNDQLRQKIAPLELFTQLEEMGLITRLTSSQPSVSSLPPLGSQLAEIVVPSPMTNDQITINEQPTQSESPNHEKQTVSSQEFDPEPLIPLDFHEIKFLMSETLSGYCGLLARQLLDQIKNANNLQQLKMCQMQWITYLQESRIPPQLLNHQLQQINFSIKNMILNQ